MSSDPSSSSSEISSEIQPSATSADYSPLDAALRGEAESFELPCLLRPALIPGSETLASSKLPSRERRQPSVPDVQRAWQRLASCSHPEARKLLPFTHALRLQCLPLVIVIDPSEQKLLAVVTANLDDPELAKELQFISGCEVILERGEPDLIERAIHAAYLGSAQSLAEALSGARESVPEREKSPAVAAALSASASAGAPLLLEAVLERADALCASDIHLEPSPDGMRLRFRVDGRLRTDAGFVVQRTLAANLLRRVKLLAGLDITRDFEPQEGGFTFAIGKRELRLRVSVLPQVHGEKVVLRRLENQFLAEHRDKAVSLFRTLGLRADQERLVLSHAGANSGLILVSGPTGSGKSTLLYALLEHLNAEWRNVVTLEDPVERYIPGVNQTDVSRTGKLRYAEMLAPLLRQDPDVIMLGEIRDRETAETALQAATTGHLVLSTVHAGSTPEVLLRMLNLGVRPFHLGAAVRLVIAQRLVPLSCRSCLRPVRCSRELARLFRLEQVISPSARAAGVALFTGEGCAACGGTGISGRRGIYELLPMSAELRTLLTALRERGPELSELLDCVRAASRPTLAEQVRMLLIEGLIDPAAALRTLGVAPEIMGLSQEKASVS